jgi:hypothetical protein
MATFSPSSSRAAFLDELEKIAEAMAGEEDRKKWLKNALLIAAGAGAGTGAVMLGDRAIGKVIGPSWGAMSPAAKRLLVGPALGLTTIGALVAAERLYEEQQKKGKLKK